ncbi:MAG: hypothetical protein ABEK01_04920 [Candidatus Nanohaloarchaea archaeon]
MTSTSSKLLGLMLLGVILTSVGTSSFHNSEAANFEVPEYDTNREIFIHLVAPFIFIFVLLQYGFTRALHYTLLDQEDSTEGPDVRRYATVLALSATGMMMFTPAWERLRTAAQGFGGFAVAVFVGLLAFTVYSMAKS